MSYLTHAIPRATSCEWVLDTANGEHTYCGGQPQSPHSYCTEHMALAYRTEEKETVEKEMDESLKQATATDPAILGAKDEKTGIILEDDDL